MRLKLSAALCLAMAIPAFAPAPSAGAQPAKECSRDDAKNRYLKGVELFEEGDYDAALIEFKRSYECVPNFNVLYNIGQVYFQLKDYANALKTLQQYLDDGAKRIPQTRRSEVERDVETLKTRVATITIKVNMQGADIFIDDVKVGTSPLAGPIPVSAGRRKFDAYKEGYRATPKTEEIAGQETREIVLELQASSQVVVPPTGGGGEGGGAGGSGPIGPDLTQPEGPPPPIAPIVSWSLTGATVIATAVMGGLALSADSSLQDMKREPGNSPDELESQANQARGFGIAADVLLGVSIIGAGLSTYFTIDYVLTAQKPPEEPEEKTEEAPATSLVVGPGFTGLCGTFH